MEIPIKTHRNPAHKTESSNCSGLATNLLFTALKPSSHLLFDSTTILASCKMFGRVPSSLVFPANHREFQLKFQLKYKKNLALPQPAMYGDVLICFSDLNGSSSGKQIGAIMSENSISFSKVRTAISRTFVLGL